MADLPGLSQRLYCLLFSYQFLELISVTVQERTREQERNTRARVGQDYFQEGNQVFPTLPSAQSSPVGREGQVGERN